MKRKFMNSKEVKKFIAAVKEQYGTVPRLFSESAFAEGNEKIYLVGRDVDKLPLEELHINSVGLYVAEFKNDQLRLPIEGSQLVGPVAVKNVCEVLEYQAKEWLKGNDLHVDGTFDGFVIIKFGNDFLGSGKFKAGVIFNYVPKVRRIADVH